MGGMHWDERKLDAVRTLVSGVFLRASCSLRYEHVGSLPAFRKTDEIQKMATSYDNWRASCYLCKLFLLLCYQNVHLVELLASIRGHIPLVRLWKHFLYKKAVVQISKIRLICVQLIDRVWYIFVFWVVSTYRVAQKIGTIFVRFNLVNY